MPVRQEKLLYISHDELQTIWKLCTFFCLFVENIVKTANKVQTNKSFSSH